MKYYLISTDNLDQIQFIPHPKRDVNLKGRIVELTEEELKEFTLGYLDTASKDCRSAIRKVRKVLE